MVSKHEATLLRLPHEIRLNIYEELFRDVRVQTCDFAGDEDSFWPWDRIPVALIFTCKLIHTEAAPVFYRLATFKFGNEEYQERRSDPAYSRSLSIMHKLEIPPATLPSLGVNTETMVWTSLKIPEAENIRELLVIDKIVACQCGDENKFWEDVKTNSKISDIEKMSLLIKSAKAVGIDVSFRVEVSEICWTTTTVFEFGSALEPRVTYWHEHQFDQGYFEDMAERMGMNAHQMEVLEDQIIAARPKG